MKLIAMVMFLTALSASANAGDNSERVFRAYPSPVERGAVLTVEMPTGDGEVTVILFNIVGKVLQTHTTANKILELNAPEISGIYLLRFLKNQEVIYVERFVVKE